MNWYYTIFIYGFKIKSRPKHLGIWAKRRANGLRMWKVGVKSALGAKKGGDDWGIT